MRHCEEYESPTTEEAIMHESARERHRSERGSFIKIAPNIIVLHSFLILNMLSKPGMRPQNVKFHILSPESKILLFLSF